jgi:outer membrane scaffolding protein for murein synthesis (MipA/OmpV family)
LIAVSCLLLPIAANALEPADLPPGKTGAAIAVPTEEHLQEPEQLAEAVGTIKDYDDMIEPDLEDEAVPSDWRVIVGGGAGYVPDYLGSDDYEFVPVPVLSVHWKDRVFLNLQGFGLELSGLGANLIQTHGFNIGPLVNIDKGRDESDNSALEGLADIDPTPLVGGFVDYRDGPWNAYAYDFAVAKGLQITPGIGTTYYSSDYNQAYFGITAKQSSDSGLPEFDPDGGFWNVGVTTTAVYLITDEIGLIGAAGYTRMLGEAADSPLVEDEGSENQFVGSLAAFYRF